MLNLRMCKKSSTFVAERRRRRNKLVAMTAAMRH